ncbi:MAG TPA: hypothetical protein VK689_06250 [Armatimonadota bacterium]|nr:hypothetical protein [Armatimonadota bacterium]
MAERVHVDQIGGEVAVLLLQSADAGKVTVPARLLPPGTREGAALDLSLTRAPNDTTGEEVESLIAELFPNAPP